MTRYTLEPGRHIARDGVAVAYVQRTGDSVNNWALAPWEVDTLAHECVAGLNVLGVLPELLELLSHPSVRYLICDGVRAGSLGEQAKYHRVLAALQSASRVVESRK